MLVDALMPLLPDLPDEHSNAHSKPNPMCASPSIPSTTTSSSTNSFSAPTTGGAGLGLSWPKLRGAGAGFWLVEAAALRGVCEGLARLQYARSKDPHDCALIYAALGKKSVLQGLFRSSGNKKVGLMLAV